MQSEEAGLATHHIDSLEPALSRNETQESTETFFDEGWQCAGWEATAEVHVACDDESCELVSARTASLTSFGETCEELLRGLHPIDVSSAPHNTSRTSFRTGSGRSDSFNDKQFYRSSRHGRERFNVSANSTMPSSEISLGSANELPALGNQRNAPPLSPRSAATALAQQSQTRKQTQDSDWISSYTMRREELPHSVLSVVPSLASSHCDRNTCPDIRNPLKGPSQ